MQAIRWKIFWGYYYLLHTLHWMVNGLKRMKGKKTTGKSKRRVREREKRTKTEKVVELKTYIYRCNSFGCWKLATGFLLSFLFLHSIDSHNLVLWLHLTGWGKVQRKKRKKNTKSFAAHNFHFDLLLLLFVSFIFRFINQFACNPNLNGLRKRERVCVHHQLQKDISEIVDHLLSVYFFFSFSAKIFANDMRTVFYWNFYLFLYYFFFSSSFEQAED